MRTSRVMVGTRSPHINALTEHQYYGTVQRDPSKYVEFEFDKVGLRKEEIVAITKSYTNETFTVEYTAGESKAWIKFDDEANRAEFVENIKETKEEG